MGSEAGERVLKAAPARVQHHGLAGPALRGEAWCCAQDFGARDPFAAEIESNFGEKVLGNYNTDHKIK